MSKKTAQAHLDRKIDFSALTPGQQRVMIASDALARIEVGTFTPQSGTYLEFRGFPPFEGATASINPGKVGAKHGCTVCALGACFVASFERCPKQVTMSLSSRGESTLAEITDAAIKRELQGIFSSEQLSLMETAFECDSAFSETGDSEISSTAAAFGSQFKSDKARLRAILENIIENCGEFIPKIAAVK